jgi:hypothetical protein
VIVMRRIQFVFLFVASLIFCAGLPAQENPTTPAPQQTSVKPAAIVKTPPVHKFWDKENDLLFAGVGAARMMDYASTRHFRDQGDNEVLLTNAIVDNRPLFVGIELAGTAASIGVSYLFHRTGHHTLERWVSIGHIGVAVGGSIHNYALKPAPISVQPVASGLMASSVR